MPDVVFTRYELEQLNKYQLKKLAKYYKIRVYKTWTKERIVDAIAKHIISEPEKEDVPEMSVRVRRIRESSRS